MRFFPAALAGVILFLLAGIAAGAELEEIESLWAAGARDSALALVTTEVEAARAASDSVRLLSFILHEGAYRASFGDHRRGETVLRQTVMLAETLGDSTVLVGALRWLGVTISSQGRETEALDITLRQLKISRIIGDRRHEGWALVGLAWDAWGKGDGESAKEHYTLAAERFAGTEDVEGELWSRNGLAMVLTNRGEYEEALASYRASLARARQANLPMSVAIALNGIGSLEYPLGRPDQALDHFRQAVEIHCRQGHRSQIITPLSNIALCQNRLGRPARARETLEGILATCRVEGYAGLETTARLKLAETFIILGRPRAAEELCRENLAPGRELQLINRVGTHIALSEALKAQDRYREALAELERVSDLLKETTLVWQQLRVEGKLGLIATHLGHHREARSHFLALADRAQATGVMEFQFTSLGNAARCSELLAEPDSALSLYRQAAAGWEAERRLLLDPDWRERRGNAGQRIFTDLGALLVSRGEIALAFDRLQVYKARTLLERMLGPGKRHESILAAETPTVDLAEFQAEVLGEDELFLDIYLGPDHSLLFAVSRTEILCRELPPTGELEDRLRAYHDLLASPDAADPAIIAESGAKLADTLFGDCETLFGQYGTVVVAPDGALNLLPFRELPGCEDRTWLRVPGAAVMARLRQVEGMRSPRGSWRTLALASGRDDTGQALPGALREVESLAARYRDVTLGLPMEDPVAGGAAGPVTASAGIAEALAGFEILHFAAHARNDDQSPWQSAIYIHESGEPLRAAEIAGMDLDARLAVLSSCSSAAGGIVSGEGVLGLASAFLSAGVPTVLATLWTVDDAATAYFINYFYAALARGLDCVGALTEAQDELKKYPETRHPYYWAGFVILGEGGLEPRLDRRSNYLFPLAGLLILILLLVGLRGHRHRHSP